MLSSYIFIWLGFIFLSRYFLANIFCPEFFFQICLLKLNALFNQSFQTSTWVSENVITESILAFTSLVFLDLSNPSYSDSLFLYGHLHFHVFGKSPRLLTCGPGINFIINPISLGQIVYMNKWLLVAKKSKAAICSMIVMPSLFSNSFFELLPLQL